MRLELGAGESPLPVWIAAYGPKALALAGRVADGVILQFADPHLISWCMGFVREAAAAAGRDPDAIKVMAAAPVWVADDLDDGARACALVPGAGLQPRDRSDPRATIPPSCPPS